MKKKKNLKRTSKKSSYQRLILKISGEILGGRNSIFNIPAIDYIIEQIAAARNMGVKIGVVVGGGNLVRGRQISWLNKVDADLCGMMATVINGIVLHSRLLEHGITSRLCSSIEINGIIRRFNKFEDRKFYEKGEVLLFVAGTGNPLFTTDTAAALRAVELDADILIKATKVEGVYTADPKKDKKAKLFKTLTFKEAIAKNLAVMDLSAFKICKDAGVPICVYNLMKYPLSRIIKGDKIGTFITKGRTK